MISSGLLLAGLLQEALAEPIWVPAGPERGGVVSAAVGPTSVSVVTSAGVMIADPGLEAWDRDPRMPPGTRRVAYGPDGTVWAATTGRIWRVRPGAPSHADLVACLPAQSTAVGLATTEEGDLVALVRGAVEGLLRLDAADIDMPALATGPESADPRCAAGPGQNPPTYADGALRPFTWALGDVDPWKVATWGHDVLLATLDAGAWLSGDGGRSFERVLANGPVATVAFVHGEPWLGLPDGRLLRGLPPRDISDTTWGAVSDIVPYEDGALISAERGILRWSIAQGLSKLTLHLDDDPRGESVTGLWALTGGDVLVGTSRNGPLRWSANGLRTARKGFRATVGGGAGSTRSGDVLLALPGAGAFLTTDVARTWLLQAGPAAPSAAARWVAAEGDAFAVSDPDGWSIRDVEGAWTRMAGANPGAAGRPSGPVHLGIDGDGSWWATDLDQELWLWNEEAWDRCLFTGSVRLDGAGATLTLVTTRGLFRRSAVVDPLHCEAGWSILPVTMSGRADFTRARAADDWVAVPGEVRYQGVRVGTVPDQTVSALAVRRALPGTEALVGTEDGSVTRCRRNCERFEARVGSAPVALGWFPDGTVWALEALGTFLVLRDGNPADSVKRWPDAAYGPGAPQDLSELERPSWDEPGRRGSAETPSAASSGEGHAPGPTILPAAESKAASAPENSTHLLTRGLWLVTGGLLLFATGILGRWWIGRSRR
jgi:hypothetical protein